MESFENITIADIVKIKENFEKQIEEEKSNIAALKYEEENYYTTMLKEIKNGLIDLNDIYKELKLNKNVFDTDFKYTVIDGAIKIGICLRKNFNTAEIQGIQKNSYSDVRLPIYDGADINHWNSEKNIMEIYKNWDNIMKTIKQQMIIQYKEEKSKELEELRKEYELKSITVNELKGMLN